jgi:HTH-type transcriptional regulator/antitoxin HigA
MGEVLIPTRWQRELLRKRNIAAVKKLADELGIAPSIVPERTQRETLELAWGQALRREFELFAKTQKP